MSGLNGYPKDSPGTILINEVSAEQLVFMQGREGECSLVRALLSFIFLDASQHGWRGPGIQETKTHVYANISTGFYLDDVNARQLYTLVHGKFSTKEEFHGFLDVIRVGGFSVTSIEPISNP